MERVISDLLDLATIEQGRLTVELAPWKVSTLLSEALELMGPLARERKLQLHAIVGEADTMVRCDRDRTLQVFSNLVGNAVKFTPEGGGITLRVEPDDGAVRVSVEDTGPGIPAERNDRRDVGLGLSIASGIITAQGGRLWVDSTVGVGTRFRFTLLRA
jgi:signal transduction histidine kinase